MPRTAIFVLIACALPATAQPLAAERHKTTGGSHILDSLAFEENRGQFDRRVRFALRVQDCTAFFLDDRVTIGFRAKDGRASSITMKLSRRSRRAKVEGLDALPIRTNYFLGNDTAQWVRGATHYAKLRYRDVYPGVDLVFRWEAGKQLEYDWVVAPGGDPSAIRVSFDSGVRMARDGAGDLVVGKDGFVWRHRKPSAFQQADGSPSPVGASFRSYSGRMAGFDVSSYDRARTLVIDPVAVFSITFGGQTGSVGDSGNAVAYNPALNSVYVAGTALSLNFPRGDSGFQARNGGSDAFVALVGIGDAGAAVALNAYFLGGSLNGGATGVAFDPQGNVYLAGYTLSSDFPVVNAMQTAPGGGFVAKFTPDFSALIYSTYVGSLVGPQPSSFPLAVAADAGGSAYVTGTTSPSLFTATAGAFQTMAAGPQPAFALKLDPSGKLVFATLLGAGNGNGDNGNGIAVDASSNPYIVGFAGSANFPTTTGVIQPACTAHIFNGCSGAFVTKLNASGTGLVYSTFLGGGSAAYATAVALDSAGNAYVTGGTLTPNPVYGGVNFPTTPGAYQQTTQAGIAAFVSKLNATGTALVYSTLLAGQAPVFDGGGSGAAAIALDQSGGAYVTGHTEQSDFPLLDPLQTAIGSEQTCLGENGTGGEICGDAFVSKLTPDGSALEWSTYLGGSSYDSGAGIAASGGDVYVTGVTASWDFPGEASFPYCISPENYSGCVGYPVIPGSVFLLHLNESANAAGLSAPGVTNAASFASGVSPGALTTIFGTGFTTVAGVQTATCCPLPTELGGVQVFFSFNGETVPLLAVSSQQINLVAPWDLQPGIDPSYVPVIVYVNGAPSLPIMAAFSPYQPALYTANGTGAIAQHGADYSLITAASPAQPGEIVILYGNGLGPVQPAVALGAPAPSMPPATTIVNPVVTIGGAQAEVLFSGLAPGLVNLYQLDVRVPLSTPPGNQEVVATVNSAVSPPFNSPTATLPIGPAQ